MNFRKYSQAGAYEQEHRTLIKKYMSTWTPSLLGITVSKEVISMVKMILFSREKLEVRKL